MIRLYDRNNDPARLSQIVDCLDNGGVIIYRTDTTYALGCHALKERAVEKICQIRGINPKEHPLSIICYDLSAISEYAHISNSAFKLIKRNTPGAFTFILKGKKRLPKIFHLRTQDEVGIRMPKVPTLQEILHLLNAPLMTISLPLDDLENDYLTNPELVDEAFGKMVDLVVDSGEGVYGQSTIVNCIDEDFQILRQGDGRLVL